MFCDFGARRRIFGAVNTDDDKCRDSEWPTPCKQNKHVPYVAPIPNCRDLILPWRFKSAIMIDASMPLRYIAQMSGPYPLVTMAWVANAIRGNVNVPHFWPTTDRNLPVCVACGYGDNSAHQWARFCIVPMLVASSLLLDTQTITSLDQVARSRNTGCIVASHTLH